MERKIKEKIIKGVAASPGIGIGTPFLYVHENLNVTREIVTDSDIENEIRKYKAAIEKTKEQIVLDRKTAVKKAGAEAGRILDAHLLIVEDPVLIDDAVHFITEQNVQASYAVNKVMKDYQTAFEKMPNNYYSQRAADIEDVCRRIVKNLIEDYSPRQPERELKGRQIVISDNIYPSDTLNFNRDFVLGIITEYGGKTSHAAILSRSMEVPAVVGATGITKWISKASLIIVDGYTGKIILNPSPNTFELYKKKQHEQEDQVQEDLKYSKLPSVTLDGQKIRIMSNIQSSLEVDNVLKWNSEGVGLFRTEFLFESSYSLLSEDEQFTVYESISGNIYPEELSIRLLDIGGDKLNDKLSFKEDNPFLGVRGMRLLFKHPALLRSHLRAILRASHRGNISIIIPFVANITEIKKIRNLIDTIKSDLERDGLSFDKNIRLGVMIEIPSIVMIADAVAKITDFFSIGTNDLTQYVLAADRGNEKVSYIYDNFHPAVIKMIDITIRAAKRGKIPVGLCGQMAGYPLAIPLLLGLGLREFSVTPFLVPVVKKIIRRLDTAECRTLAKKCLRASSARAITATLSDFFEKKIGDNPLQ
jgi:phosphoenolpyruvate-protein phosphotransferase (PTS system enzyme I)